MLHQRNGNSSIQSLAQLPFRVNGFKVSCVYFSSANYEATLPILSYVVKVKKRLWIITVPSNGK